MFKANPKDAIIRRQIESVEFGFYSDKDVRDRSVAEITSSQAFDPTHNPLPGGLYDSRLGPTAKDSDPVCTTCALSASACPGHFGHIELAVQVYHPLLMADLVTALRLKCLNCHKLRAAARPLAIYRAKFNLLKQHNVAELLDLDDTLAQSVRHARDGTGESAAAPVTTSAAASKRSAGLALDQALREFQPLQEEDEATANANNHKRNWQETSYERKLRKQLIHECMAACKGSKSCPHCGACSPKIRQDSYNKIFQAALSAKTARMNAAEGIQIVSAMQTDKEAGYDSEDTDREMDDNENEGEQDDDDDEENDNDDDNEGKSDKRDKYMHAGEVQAQMKRLWKTDPYLCNFIFGQCGSWSEEGYQIFFLQAVPVPPSRFRPAMHLNGMAVEHSQTQYLSKMIQLNEQIRNHFAAGNEPRAYTSWIDLQTAVNCYMDSAKDPSAAATNQVAPGIRQILERKEGLFRKNMMGKRVDYACRSVISPDPYVGTNEIGLPQYFARVLTYPTPVTDLNLKEMRQLVERGAHDYPGARWVEIAGKRVDLSKMKRFKREAVAAQLLTHLKKGGMPALVGRQLRDGDYVLMNRQPTLHKPGIMAHRVRILHNPTQKTIRMHYANCNTYNADFDGDEMNCHFPQSDLARAEAQYIAKTDLQYIVPTDGSPLRGLIQDHVVAGVKLTKRDTFLEKWEYQQLLFAALASLPGLEVIESDMDIELAPPAVIRPRELWTGKQVISTLLLHLRKGKNKDSATLGELPGISCSGKAKTPETAFGSKQEEHLVLIRDGELLRGVLDKNAYGATDFSLVHAVFEAYGPEKAGLLLNSLGRLFTAYIQFYSGHSCRMEDLVLTKEADETRRKLVQRAYNIGARAAKAWADSEGGKVAIPSVKDQAGSEHPLKPVETASASVKIGQLLSGTEGATNFANLDGYMQGQLNPLASEIVKTCLPSGLAVPFPYNTFSVMTTTGAKGSIVNQSQVTCALGQQALEGRRVPRLSSGRTLPSFAPFDPNPRADGFVMDRFLTGIRPQEYYFHCMAGREGLVDTAVKTSRSGYLQRCLMKHLEELKLCYDYTVRNAEGGVIQFLYGEDGLDPTKASYLDCTDKSFEFMARNHHSIARQNLPLPSSTIEIATADAERGEALESDTPRHPFVKGDLVRARKLRVGTEWKRGALCVGWHEAIITKTHKKGKTVDLKYVKDGQTSKDVPVEVNLGRCGGRQTPAWSSKATIVMAAVADPILTTPDRGHRLGSSGACVSERVAKAAADAMDGGKLGTAMKSVELSKKKLGALVAAKYSSSLCAPGEAVGSIAAQSIGEPSTQMTLNTFHLAGAGANVTLGIPRLREIIMTASRVLKTPTMSVPLHANVTDKKAVRMTRFFTKLTLMELISGNKGISVTERLEKGDNGNWDRAYYVVIKLHPAERVREAFGLSLVDVARVVAKNYVPLLTKMMKDELKRSAVGSSDASEVLGGGSSAEVDIVKTGDDEGETVRAPASANFADELDDADNEGDDDDAPGEEDGVEASRHRRRKESVSYDDEGDEDSTDGRPAQTARDETQEDDASSDPADTTAMVYERKDHPTVNERANTISLQPLKVDPSARPLLMVGLVEKAASVTLVRSRDKIDQGFINDEEQGRGRCFQTAGVNFPELWELDNVDHNRLMSNDIWALRCAYGVEAARSSIGQQVTSVFGAYGIEVDPRHLSLIADYMTHDGGFKAMNRIGIEGSSSTLLQMSFETTVHFLRQSAIRNTRDTLDSPSANIVMGRPIRHGTGAFTLLTK